MTKEKKSDATEPTDLEIDNADSLDDESRRALLAKIARVGAASVPVSMVLLNKAEAQNTGSTPPFG